MNKPLITLFWSLYFLAINTCSISEPLIQDKILKFSIQAGANKGGITENKDISFGLKYQL